VYVAPDGTVHILNPHKHNETVINVLLQNNVPEGYHMVPDTLPKSDIDHNAMMRYLGLMRTQFLLDGVGVSIEVSRLPTEAQVQAIMDYYATTTQKSFVAEVSWHGKLLAHLMGPGDLMFFLNRFDAKDPRFLADPKSAIREHLRVSIKGVRLVTPMAFSATSVTALIPGSILLMAL